MPGTHRKFLAEVSGMSKIKDFVFSQPSSPEQEQLLQAYQRATQAFGDFRSAHMKMVTRYIIVPSRKANPFALRRNLATASLRSDKGIASGLTGTGGTELIPFLRTTRDETYRAGRTAA
jgi:indoleamine 2,3-dioxygenase